MIDGVRTTGRLKENMVAGSYMLTDRDAIEGMPAVLADLDFERWCAAMATIFPGFDSCGRVMLPSTKGRIRSTAAVGRSARIATRS